MILSQPSNSQMKTQVLISLPLLFAFAAMLKTHALSLTHALRRRRRRRTNFFSLQLNSPTSPSVWGPSSSSSSSGPASRRLRGSAALQQRQTTKVQKSLLVFSSNYSLADLKSYINFISLYNEPLYN